jgi:hypothetical protein
MSTSDRIPELYERAQEEPDPEKLRALIEEIIEAYRKQRQDKEERQPID